MKRYRLFTVLDQEFWGDTYEELVAGLLSARGYNDADPSLRRQLRAQSVPEWQRLLATYGLEALPIETKDAQTYVESLARAGLVMLYEAAPEEGARPELCGEPRPELCGEPRPEPVEGGQE